MRSEELEDLERRVGAEVAVQTVDASYHFSDVYGKMRYCAGSEISSRGPRTLRKVEVDGIVIDDIFPGGQEHIPFASEVRFTGSEFLGGLDSETYCVEMIAKIEVGNETIFKRSPEDYMPDDLKGKLTTHKHVHLPPPVDLDE